MTEKLDKVINEKSEQDRYAIRIITRAREIKWVEVSGVFVEWEGNPAALILLSTLHSVS